MREAIEAKVVGVSGGGLIGNSGVKGGRCSARKL